MESLKDYLITPLTVAMIPHPSEEEWKTIIFHGFEEWIVEKKCKDIVNDSMHQFGTDLSGAILASKHILGNIYVAPVKLDYSLDLFLIPTLSPNHLKCTWLSHNQIRKVGSKKNNTTEVYLNYGHRLQLDMSLGSLKKKINQCEKLKSSLTDLHTNVKVQEMRYREKHDL